MWEMQTIFVLTASEDDLDLETSTSEDDLDLKDHPDELLESEKESQILVDWHIGDIALEDLIFRNI